MLYCNGSIVNLSQYVILRDGKFFFRFLLRLYLISQSLHYILQIIYCIYYTLFYKKLIYKKLGLASFKTQEASRAAIIFLTKFSLVES